MSHWPLFLNEFLQTQKTILNTLDFYIVCDTRQFIEIKQQCFRHVGNDFSVFLLQKVLIKQVP